MATDSNDDSKTTLDPGNTLFVLYIGFILFCLFLAIVVDSHASITPAEVRQDEAYIPAPYLSQDVEIYGTGRGGRKHPWQATANRLRTCKDTIQWNRMGQKY